MDRDYKLASQIFDSQEDIETSACIEAAELVLSGYSRDAAIAKVKENHYARQEALSKNEYVEQDGDISFYDSSLNYKTVDNPPAQILAIANELQEANGYILE